MNAEIANDNIIRLADRIECRINRYMPLLQATGVLMDPWAGDKLSDDLDNAAGTIGRAMVVLAERASSERNVAQLRAVALLRRVQGVLKQSAKRAGKLERKLSKAKRKAKGK